MKWMILIFAASCLATAQQASQSVPEKMLSGNQVTGQMYATCYDRPAPPPLTAYTVLSGGILVFDAEDLRKWRASGARDEDIPAPLMAQAAGTDGGKPLIAAAKKLRKVID